MSQIERATSADYSLFRTLFEELHTGDPGTPVATFERDIVPNMWIMRDESSAALGYVFGQVFGAACYVRHLVTSPVARRKGVARALLQIIAEDARCKGADSIELNVKLDNDAAIALYRGSGMAPVYETSVLHLRWKDVPELDRGPPPARVAASEAHEVEARFQLPSGLIAGHAASGEHVVCATRDAGGSVSGVASFMPTFPGIFPLRATNVEDGWRLIAAMSPLAIEIRDAERPWRQHGVQVAVEDAREVAASLEQHGARTVFRIVHMRGPL